MQTSRAEQIYYTFLLLLAVTIPSGVYFLSIVIAGLLFIWCIVQGYFWKNFSNLKHPEAWLPAMFYALTVIDFFISDNRTSATGYLSSYFSFLLPVVIYAGPQLSDTRRKLLLKAFIISLCVNLFACLAFGAIDIFRSGQSLILLETGTWYHKLSSFGLTRLFHNWHPTYISEFAVWGIAFIIAYRSHSKTDRLFEPLTETILLVFLLINIVLLNSIAAASALIIILIISFTRYLSQRKISPAIIAVILTVVIGSTSILVYTNPFRNGKIDTLKQTELKITDKEGERNFFTIRLAKWASHAELLAAHPIWGVTPADIKKERKEIYIKKNFEELARLNYNAHNQYLETACRFGIPGLCLLVLLLFIPFFRMTGNYLYLAFIITSCVVFLTESFFERHQGLISFMFMYAILTKDYSRNLSKKIT
jgi:O-antigen ligase